MNENNNQKKHIKEEEKNITFIWIVLVINIIFIKA